MPRRFYVKFQGVCWSFSGQSYSQLLADGAVGKFSSPDLSRYAGRQIKRFPISAQPIDVTDFEDTHYYQEWEYFLKTNGQTGFAAADYIDVFFDD